MLSGERPIDEENANKIARAWIARFLSNYDVKEALKHVLSLDAITSQDPNWLVHYANHDPVMWEAARDLAADFIEAGSLPPAALREVAVNVLRGSESAQKPPPKKGRKAVDHGYRNIVIRTTAYLLREFGYTPFSPSGTHREGRSVCGIISGALKNLGFDSIDPEAVYKVWSKASPNEKENLPHLIAAADKKGRDVFTEFVASEYFNRPQWEPTESGPLDLSQLTIPFGK